MHEQELSFRDRLAKMLPPEPLNHWKVPHKTSISPTSPKTKSFAVVEYDPSQFPLQMV